MAPSGGIGRWPRGGLGRRLVLQALQVTERQRYTARCAVTEIALNDAHAHPSVQPDKREWPNALALAG